MQEKSSSKASRPTRSAATMMLNTCKMVIRDFQTTLSDPGFCLHYVPLLTERSIPELRQVASAVTYSEEPCVFKAQYQVESLLKRYRFNNDLYTEDELLTKAVAGFKATQLRLASLPDWRSDKITEYVMDKARSYIARVLGVYSDEEHRSLCRFGKRATVGVPSRMACEGQKWELPLTGSYEQICWFDSEMSQVDSVQNYWLNQLQSDPPDQVRSIYQQIEALKLTLVPKTFKSLRSIMPNSTIGSYMSFGLGEMITRRLRRNGYDINTLQVRHRHLARSASASRLLVTADLSSASDSISVSLVEQLFPSDWLEVLKASRIGKVVLPTPAGQETIESLTFCTMGVGYTFPLQTLIFLALLHGVRAFLGAPGKRLISVYGDDMIYHHAMHKQVERTFKQLGFILNVDKTYVDEYFRESCGGDYYRGVDVRPFQPKNGPADISNKAYEALLYKTINGLLMRWSEYEIEQTLCYLITELEHTCGKVKLVPPMFPDDAGVKVSFPTLPKFLEGRSLSLPKFVGHGLYRFSYLRLKVDVREEVRHEPYLWLALRDRLPPAVYQSDGDTVGSSLLVLDSSFLRELEATAERTPLLITREKVPIEYTRSKISGVRHRRLETCVVINNTGSYHRQSGISSFR